MFLTLPWRNFTRNRWRTFLIVLGIAVSVGLETGIAVSVDSLYGNFIENHRGNNFTDITIHSKSNSTLLEMQELEQRMLDIDGVKKSSLVATFTLNDLPSFIQDQPLLENITNAVILYGFEPENHPDFPQLEVINGNKTLDRFEQEVIISESIGYLAEVTPGQKFYIPDMSEYGVSATTATISGTIDDRENFGNHNGFLFILINLNYLLEIFEDESYLNFHIVIEVNDFININSIAQRIEDTLGLDYLVFREKFLSETDILAIRSYQTAMNLIIIASFVVEFLFITNILTINIKERSSEFGILRASGTSKIQVILFLGFEILFYSGLGSIIGNIIGIGFSYIIVFFLNVNYPHTVDINALLLLPTSILSAFVTGILIALIAGLYPIALSVNLPVIQNIHWKMRTKKVTSNSRVISLISGGLLIISGFITTYFIGPSRFLSFEILSWHFIAIGAVFAGTLLLESAFLHFVPKLGKKLMLWHKKVPRIIATRNIEREPQKALLTIMVTALALSFILVVGIVSDGLIESFPDYYNERFGRIDIIAETKDNVQIPPSFVNDLMESDNNILRAGAIQQQRTTISSIQGYVFGINNENFDYFFKETMVLPAEPHIPTLLNSSERGIIISHFLVSRIGLRLGEYLDVQTSSNSSIQMKITGIAAGNPFLQHGNYIFCSDDLFRTLWQNQSVSYVLMSTRTDVNLYIMKDQLLSNYTFFAHCTAVDFYAEAIEKSLIIQKAFFQTLFFHTFLLAGLAQFISILISTLKTEREVGIMRSMGLTKKDVFSIFFAESTIYGILGVIFGIINGVIGAELITWYIGKSLPIKTSISPNLILFWISASFLVTITSTIIPSYRASNKSVIEAITTYAPRQIKANPIIWDGWDKMMAGILKRRQESMKTFPPLFKDKEQ